MLLPARTSLSSANQGESRPLRIPHITLSTVTTVEADQIHRLKPFPTLAMSTTAQNGCVASSTDDADVTAVMLSRHRPRQRPIAKQYDEAAQQTLTHTDEPYKIIWGNRIFVISGILNKRKSRGRRSWITREGWFLTELTRTGKVKQDVWCCRRCDARGKPQFFSAQSTSASQGHLQRLEKHSSSF